MEEQRSRGWCFTINNPTIEDSTNLSTLADAAEYVTYGAEQGENGTFHYQGYARFKHPQSFRRVHSIIPRAHIEKQRGGTNDAIAYCHKDGDFIELGERPGEKRTNKEMWRWIIDKAEGGDLDAIKDEYPGIYLRYLDKLRSLRVRGGGILDGQLQHEWWHGPTGTGKSRTVWSMYPNHYQKELNKWWDGYRDQETVVIEEWAPKNECTASALKIWADRYPFSAQIKGGTLLKIRPTKIIITSNYTIDECFQDEQDREPIKRRFKQVYFPHTIFIPRNADPETELFSL